jgi:hypothetical protein
MPICAEAGPEKNGDEYSTAYETVGGAAVSNAFRT